MIELLPLHCDGCDSNHLATRVAHERDPRCPFCGHRLPSRTFAPTKPAHQAAAASLPHIPAAAARGPRAS